MVDRNGTLVGCSEMKSLVGAGLIPFGIAWPGPLANGYVCRIASAEAQLNKLKQSAVPRGRMEALAAAQEESMDSWRARNFCRSV